MRAWLAAACCALALSGGCAGNYKLVARGSDADGVVWIAPTASGDLRALDRWRQSVGPALVLAGRTAGAQPSRRLIAVSWNVAVGAGDVIALLRDLRQSYGPDTPVLLLLQEAYRNGPDVPKALSRGASFASRLGAARGGSRQDDIGTLAVRTGLHAYYAPSMRNGSPLVSDEDRGNAILSSLPLSELAALELPFERQRRVAIAATLTGFTSGGSAWTMRVVSAHLDNMAGRRRLWILGSSYARTRQARAIVAYLDAISPAVLAGDFNTWFGFADPAYRETARAFRSPLPEDRRGTFRGGLRLDHMFFRLPDGWSARTERGPSRYGSDHFPLVARIDMP